MNIPTGSVVEIVDTRELDSTKYRMGQRGVAYQVRDAWPEQGWPGSEFVLVFFRRDCAHRAQKLLEMTDEDVWNFHRTAYAQGEQAFIKLEYLKMVMSGKMPSRRGKRHRYKERALKFEEA